MSLWNFKFKERNKNNSGIKIQKMDQNLNRNEVICVFLSPIFYCSCPENQCQSNFASVDFWLRRKMNPQCIPYIFAYTTILHYNYEIRFFSERKSLLLQIWIGSKCNLSRKKLSCTEVLPKPFWPNFGYRAVFFCGGENQDISVPDFLGIFHRGTKNKRTRQKYVRERRLEMSYVVKQWNT